MSYLSDVSDVERCNGLVITLLITTSEPPGASSHGARAWFCFLSDFGLSRIFADVLRTFAYLGFRGKGVQMSASAIRN